MAWGYSLGSNSHTVLELKPSANWPNAPGTHPAAPNIAHENGRARPHRRTRPAKSYLIYPG